MVKDYLMELRETPQTWATLFVGDCVEHILPVVERDTLGDVQKIRRALNLSDMENVCKLLASAVATKKKKGDAAYDKPSLAMIVNLCLSLADDPEEEKRQQADKFSRYKEAAGDPHI